MRPLVAEDNASLVANLFDYFESRGHTLDAAPDGITGLHLATHHVYDIVLLDWMLPRRDGREVLRRLRLHHPTQPVIMLTARNSCRTRSPASAPLQTITCPSPLPCQSWKCAWLPCSRAAATRAQPRAGNP